MRLLAFFARRFVAGERHSDAVSSARRLNLAGLAASLDYLGEEVDAEDQAAHAAEEYVLLLEKIAEAEADANISIKLTQLGLGFDPELCRSHLLRLAEEAGRLKNFIRIDMEGSAYTQKTLEIFYDVFKKHQNLGVVIQAYLYRSQGDVEDLIQKKARVRLCKGAYKEPATVAFHKREEVNRNFDLLAERLLLHGNTPAIATHDDERIRKVVQFARENRISKDRFEFQMLYGMRRRLWKALREEGYRVRVYVPYGTHWLPYFYRRIRERKENFLFVLKNMIGG